jgi:hypothetical protein
MNGADDVLDAKRLSKSALKRFAASKLSLGGE